MNTFSQVRSYLFLFVMLFLPVLMIAAGGLWTLAFTRADGQKRRQGLRTGEIAAGLFALDLLLLKALPSLGISYGSVLYALAPALMVRLLLFVLWGVWVMRWGRAQGKPVSFLPFWAVNLAFTALLIYGFYIEPFLIQIRRVEVQTPAARLNQRLRIVQLTDIHVERTTRRERDLIPLVRSLNPDLIVLTGDYLNVSYLADPQALQDARSLFSQLSAPLGVYAVGGSNETPELMFRLFEHTPVKILQNEFQAIDFKGRGRLYLLGVADWSRDYDREALQWLANQVPAGGYHLLLYHNPDLIETAAQAHTDLYLAGHTHCGQIRLPFYGAVVTASQYGKKYEMGRYQEGNTTLYVSCGLGFEGGSAPRMRFLAPPEVTVIDLAPRP